MARYINPATDFGFKRIFKDEEITRGFLNALLKSEDPTVNIAKVSITDGEADDSSKDIRRVVYDVHCTTDTGEEFVIEMQNEAQDFFAERIVYYLARAASRQQGKGQIKSLDKDGKPLFKEWDYHLKNIYGVFFMNFKDAKHPAPLSHFAFMETKEKYRDTDVFQYWKIQMPFYRQMKESDCKTDVDKWIYNLSNMENMEKELSFTNEIPLFMRLEKIATYSALSPKQQMQYDDSFHNYVSYQGQMDFKYKEGKAEGKAEGIAQRNKEIAKEMKNNGMSEEIISVIMKLPVEEVKKLLAP